MHIDHDHIAGGEHNHQHTHAHSHEHTHDGHNHTHEHHHEHTHAPMDELVALMKYMVGHNAAHAKELADLAVKLDEAGSHASYHKVMDAVACFEKGNEMLAEVLKEQQ